MIDDDEDVTVRTAPPQPVLIALATLLTGSYPLGHWCAWQPWASGDLYLWLWPIAVAIVVVGLAIVSAMLLLQPVNRELAKRLLAVAGVTLATAMVAARFADWVVEDQALRFTVRSRPVIVAIEAYERDHGAAPATVEALVPDYLPKEPFTGIGSAPRYRIERSPDAWQLVVPRVPGGTGYRLIRPAHGEPAHGPEDSRLNDWWMVRISD